MIAGDEYFSKVTGEVVRVVRLVGTVGAGIHVCYTDDERLGEAAEEFLEVSEFNSKFTSKKTVPELAQELFVALHRLNYAGIVSDAQAKQLWSAIVNRVVVASGFSIKTTGYRTYEVTRAL